MNTEVVKDRSDPAVGGIAISYGGGDQVLTVRARSLYISVAGNLSVKMLNGDLLTFTALLAGVVYPFAVQTIYQTGSTASGNILT